MLLWKDTPFLCDSCSLVNCVKWNILNLVSLCPCFTFILFPTWPLCCRSTWWISTKEISGLSVWRVVEVQCFTFISLALDEGKWPAWHSGCSTLGKEPLIHIEYDAGCVPEPGLDALELKPICLVTHPVAWWLLTVLCTGVKLQVCICRLMCYHWGCSWISCLLIRLGSCYLQGH